MEKSLQGSEVLCRSVLVPGVFLLPVAVPVLCALSGRGHCLSTFSSFFPGKKLVFLVAIHPAWGVMVDSNSVFAVLLSLLNLR